MTKPFVFISYRRDDSAGHAGRLEEALERACGEGSVFRDVRDIQLGARFADTLKSALSAARVVVVLIGPRWAGITDDGKRRIDQESDVVRLEVVTSLNSDSKVIPVLLNGTDIPRVDELPEPMRPLFRRQALFLKEESWGADVDRLIRAIGISPERRRRRVASAAIVALLAVGGAAAYWFRSVPAPAPVDLAAQAEDRLVGEWHAHVVYGWGDRANEIFRFERFAGELTGTATFLKYPRAIEQLEVTSEHLSFVTHSTQSMGEDVRQVTHRYTAQWKGAELDVRLHSTGGFDDFPPYAFTARRAVPSEPPKAAE